MDFIRCWVQALTNPPATPPLKLTAIRNGWGTMLESRSYLNCPLCLGGRYYETGLGVHADSEVQVTSTVAMRRFCATAGVDENQLTRLGGTQIELVFSLEAGGQQRWRSQPLAVGMVPVTVDVPLDGAGEFILKVTTEDGKTHLGHADWADARVESADGQWLSLARGPGELRLPNALPFSFVYDQRESHDLFTLNTAERTCDAWREGQRNSTLTWRDPATGLTCIMELTQYENFPAVEWVLHFRNDGSVETPILKDVFALNIRWPGDSPAIPVLHRSRGSDAKVDDFLFVSQEIAGPAIRMNAGTEGRPSVDWLPFFNLQTGTEGIIIGLGWSGQWQADFDPCGSNNFRVRAGMEFLNLRLRPGETIRSPKILLLYWKGEAIHGHNILRQFVLAHHTPQSDGKPVEAPICNGSWGGTPTAEHLETIRLIQQRKLPYDYYWVDAGWYGTSTKPCPDVFSGDWSANVGDWRVNKKYHPAGLGPISDAAHQAGMKFLLWIEPERARYAAPVVREHPEWFLTDTGNAPSPEASMLLNLGCPAALEWAIETVSALIRENGIDCYREDFNYGSTLEAFKNHDAPDRRGITEIRFVEGLYAFWDELRRRHPRLLIDNCASGGRRIEIEAMSRSIPLWRSDYNCRPNIKAEGSQIQSYGLAHWVPLSATSPFAKPGDTYQFRSALSAGIVFSLGEFGMSRFGEADYPWEWHKKMMADHRRGRPFYYGDFYPLTRGALFPDTWLAYQFHRRDLHAGLILIFRPATSPFTQAVFPLRGLNPESQYVLEDADSGQRTSVAGEMLAATGLPIQIDQPRQSRLLFYQKQ
ncbi:MAG: hypothetical protein HKL95_04240 [Phycisphaerae bacterium]|nr:hypothetical protein [Phycisphaerae bacterium]